MNNKWQDRLAKLLEDKNTTHNTTTTLREAPTVPSSTGGKHILEKLDTHQTHTPKTPKTQTEGQVFSEHVRKLTPKTPKTPEAEQLGLVTTWSIEFGYISLHDPTTGEWHDLRTKDAPSWAIWEARKRKEFYKDGNRKAYRLTSHEMEKVWEAEHVSAPEGIIEDYPIGEEG